MATDAERIAAVVEQIKRATAGARVNERAVHRMGRRLSRWLRRFDVEVVHAGEHSWLPGFWGFYRVIGTYEGYNVYPSARQLGMIAEHIVESVEAEGERVAAEGDEAYRARHKLDHVLRMLGAL